jgi:hypothetical protein
MELWQVDSAVRAYLALPGSWFIVSMLSDMIKPAEHTPMSDPDQNQRL